MPALIRNPGKKQYWIAQASWAMTNLEHYRSSNMVEQPEKIIWNIVKAIFLLWCATNALLFLTGRLGLSGEKEKIRKESVKKYKWILIVVIIVLYIGGIGMLIGSIIKMF